MKKIIRWTLRLSIGLLLVVLAALLLKDPIIKSLVERRLRQETGLGITIGNLSVGLMSGSIVLTDFKVFNPPPFGAAPLLQVAETSCVLALRRSKTNRLHFNELKFNLAELNVIKNKEGLLNLESVEATLLAAMQRWEKTKSAYGFGGIDKLDLTLGKVNYTDEEQPENNVQLDLGVKNEIVTNLQTEEELNGWLNAFMVRIAFQQYLKNPTAKEKVLDSLWGGRKK